MNHYVLTRSAYGSAWSLEANARRLDITRAVTVPLMAAQTNKDFRWIVLLDPFDPLMEDRLAVFQSSGIEVIPLVWRPAEEPTHALWDRRRSRTREVERIAATAYRAPWRSMMSVGRILQTRLDDDDGLAPDAIARYQAAAKHVHRRTILMLPQGVRVWRGHYSDVTHQRNAMHTLVTTPDDDLCIYDYGHAICQKAAPITMVDRAWGWLWVRHIDTISGWRRAELKLTPEVQATFPVDWPALAAAWA